MKFSVVIPIFNGEKFVKACLDSLANQDFDLNEFEVLVVNDCSTDNSAAIAHGFSLRFTNFHLINLTKRGGPGTARNKGMIVATGDWILFLDSDDLLTIHCLSTLARVINESPSLQVIGFNWERISEPGEFQSSPRVGRRDGEMLGDRDYTVQQYLSHRMDGSVIFNAVQRKLVDTHAIRFRGGIHEDVDFAFKLYFHAIELTFWNQALYKKRTHARSIINSVSDAHVNGYFNAWRSIKNYVLENEVDAGKQYRQLQAYTYGSFGVVATRVREIFRHCKSDLEIFSLLNLVYANAKKLEDSTNFLKTFPEIRTTTYARITKLFMNQMESGKSASEITQDLKASVDEIEAKSWSCVDLHHSVFFTPDEVRTCCKRFFVNGERKGDVNLMDIPDDTGLAISPKDILTAKQSLHQKINSGVPSDCDGCPFLEFKDWGPLNSLEIHYMSLEYHSVCNLRCTYCSEEYFGGRKPRFNLEETVNGLIDNKALENCATAVWGGGEPVIDKQFPKVVRLLKKRLPKIQQRVLTNSLRNSTEVESLLEDFRGQIVTSMDAGSHETFKAIRGRSKLSQACENLKIYSEVNSNRVTIKYIFTEGNGDIDDLQKFCQLMFDYGLLQCVFQISSDFKDENIEQNRLTNMIALFGLLRKSGAKSIYFDELLWHRLSRKNVRRNIESAEQLVGEKFIADPKQYSSVVVWGAGQQASYYVKKSHFFNEINIDYFVDMTSRKIGTMFHGKEVKHPEALIETKSPVVIAAVQGYPLILEQFRLLGLSESRLISDLIL
ncbi:glycosyltransferase [Gammaproteobacteria bacterium]|nr:glycosyltransferase [Gammaproteobacteria bacterium]